MTNSNLTQPSVTPPSAAQDAIEPVRPKVQLSIELDSELVERIGHLTGDPSKLVEAALRQWLRGESGRDDELSRRLPRNPPVPPRGEWND